MTSGSSQVAALAYPLGRLFVCVCALARFGVKHNPRHHLAPHAIGLVVVVETATE